jgi:hypothetical protein
MLNRMILAGVVLATVGFGQTSGDFPAGKWREPHSPPRTLLPGTGVHDTGLLTVSIDDVGGQEAWKSTYLWPDTTSVDHLYWSWLAVGLNSQSVADAWDYDWQTTTGGWLVILEPGPVADEEGLAEFADMGGRVRVKQHTYAWDAGPDEDYIIVAYTVVNTSGAQQNAAYVSHRTDFDVMGDHEGAMTDKSGFDNSRALAYMWDVTSTTHAGVALLDVPFCGYHTGWHVADDGDKYGVMSTAGADSTTPTWDDWCFWLSAGPYQVPAGDSFDVAFAFLMGETLEDLQANADRALTRWMQLSVAEARPASVETRVATTFCRGTLVLPQASITKPQASSRLLDIDGCEVAELRPGANDVRGLAPGVYFVREAQAQAQAQAQAVRKVIVTR